jgi:copper(I)-binding protein
MIAAALVLAACAGATPQGGSATVGEIQISGAWARPSTGGQMAEGQMGGGQMEQPAQSGMGNGAAYMTIRNTGGQADRLLTAASDVAGAVELHTVVDSGGVMAMRPVDGIDVPAGGAVELKPGSFHVMMIGLKQELKPGERIALTLRFERAGVVEVQADVRQQ